MFIREIISEGEVIQGNFPNNSSPTENFNIHVFMSPAPGVQPDWFPSKPEVIKDQYDLSKYIEVLLARGIKPEHIKVQVNDTYISMPEFGITENLRAWTSHKELANILYKHTGNKQLAIDFFHLETEFDSQDDMQSTGLSALDIDPFASDRERVNNILSINNVPVKVLKMKHNAAYETLYSLLQSAPVR